MSIAALPPAASIAEELMAIERAQVSLRLIRAGLDSKQSISDQQRTVIEQLTAEVARLSRERDGYLDSLYTVTRHEKPTFTDEDRRAHQKSGQSASTLLDTCCGSKE